MASTLIAFDFDGVICDGLIEYFQTAWRAYCLLFKPSTIVPPAGLAERFYPLRPVIETGWEMPLLLRALLLGKTDAEIIAAWPSLAVELIDAAAIPQAEAAQAVDGERDRWIKADLESWLAQHRFYPHMLKILQRSLEQQPTYIVSTKEGRFIRQLLHQQGITIPANQVLGKEVKRPKYETLRQLIQEHGTDGVSPGVWFIEDRIKALQAVKQQPDLGGVELFLADWGYNLEPERQQAEQDDRISLLSLDAVVQKFKAA